MKPCKRIQRVGIKGDFKEPKGHAICDRKIGRISNGIVMV